MLRLADWLGRRRGRLRLLDQISPPAAAPLRPDLADWESHDLAAVWIGHATVLLRMGGLTILTDPVFSSRVGLGLGLLTGGPKRFFAPAIPLRELPPLDLILVSHAHFDHLDRPSLARLPKQTPVITTSHNGDLIRDLGYRRVSEIGLGETVSFGPSLKITAREVRHWGARTFFDSHRGYAAFLLEAGGRRVLFAADTAYHELFGDLAPVDLAIMGIGAYDPYIAAHATPEQAWEMANHAGARHVLPIHHSTFCLSHEPMHEPMARLLVAAGEQAGRLVVRQVGGQWHI